MAASTFRSVSAWRRPFIGGLAGALVALQLVMAAPALAAVTAEDASSAEPDDVTFIVKRATSDGSTIDYQTQDGTATAGEDYLAESGTLVFQGADTEKQLRITVLNDSLNEANETFTLELSDNGNPLDSATGTILDNDAAPRVSVADTTVFEGNTGSNPASFFVTLDRPSGQTVTVNYATANTDPVSAAAGSDYTAVPSTPLTFAPGEVSATVPVPVLGDTLSESEEEFRLNLTGPQNAEVGDGTATARIIDNDNQPIMSIEDAEAVAENAGPARFKVKLSDPSGQEVRVRATTFNGSAAAGSDFEFRNDTVTIPAGSTEAFFDVVMINNSINESTETFQVVLSAAVNATLGDFTASGTITDDDPGPKLSINDVTKVESQGLPTMSFTVTLAGATGQAVSVNFATADGTATSPTDYLGGSGNLTFLPGTTSRPILVTVNSDTLAELDETFTVNLSGAVNAEIADGSGLGTIANDDGPPAIISVNDPAAVAESATSVDFTVSLSGPVNQPVTVNYTTKDGTARAGRDYIAKSGPLTFLAGETAKTVTVNLTTPEDALDEENETFTLELSDPVNAFFNDGSGAATINDNDDPPTFIIEDVQVNEGNSRTVEVRLSAESGKEVKVDFAVVNETPPSAKKGPDYAATPDGTLVFTPGSTLPGETVERIEVTAAGDLLDEDDETFRVRLSNGVNAAAIPPALAAPNGATVTIVDDDAEPEVRITNASLEEPDNSGSTNDDDMKFKVGLSAVSGRQVKVKYATGDSNPVSATAGTDYDAVSPAATLTIPAGQAGGQILVEVNHDITDELNETFIVTLSAPENASLDPAATAATGTILDDDGPPGFTIEGTTVGESVGGGKAKVTVQMLPSHTSAMTVNYATANTDPVSAAAGSDYTATSGTLTFAPGQTVQTFEVPVASDAGDEADEKFKVTLNTPSPPAVIVQGDADVTIVDDDGPTISVSNVTVTEGNTGTTPARFTVSLSAASPQPVHVDFSTSGGTATPSVDFVSVNGPLDFAPGETSKTVEVHVAGDTLDEADEDFTFVLSGAVNGTAGLPGRGTIADDDQPKVTVAAAAEVSSGDPVVAEGNLGATAMTFTVKLDAATTRETLVDYTTQDGTALAGVDYAAMSGRLRFAPGEVTKTVVVAVHGDERDEIDETVILRLPAAINGTIVDTEAVGTILDDDGPGYALVADDGGIFAFGEAGFFGSTGDIKLNQPIVGMASHPSGRGYWLVAKDGGIFAFGEAGFFGSTGAIKLNRPIVGMAATPTGKGYWLVADDGGIFAFGDARFMGSTGAIKLNRPVVGMAATPTGKGYWLVATDGGIFAFGEAKFFGSTGDIKLNRPVVGMAAAPTGDGYWLVADDGGIFAFRTGFFGSTGDIKLNRPIVGMATTPTGKGYWLVATDGGIFAFGDATFLGSTGNIKLNRPVVGMAAL